MKSLSEQIESKLGSRLAGNKRKPQPHKLIQERDVYELAREKVKAKPNLKRDTNDDEEEFKVGTELDEKYWLDVINRQQLDGFGNVASRQYNEYENILQRVLQRAGRENAAINSNQNVASSPNTSSRQAKVDFARLDSIAEYSSEMYSEDSPSPKKSTPIAHKRPEQFDSESSSSKQQQLSWSVSDIKNDSLRTNKSWLTADRDRMKHLLEQGRAINLYRMDYSNILSTQNEPSDDSYIKVSSALKPKKLTSRKVDSIKMVKQSTPSVLMSEKKSGKKTASSEPPVYQLSLARKIPKFQKESNNSKIKKVEDFYNRNLRELKSLRHQTEPFSSTKQLEDFPSPERSANSRSRETRKISVVKPKCPPTAYTSSYSARYGLLKKEVANPYTGPKYSKARSKLIK